MIIIGVTGFRRSGKNSTTAILKRYGFREYAFADALRTMALGVDPLISTVGSPQDLTTLLPPDPIRYSELLGLVGYDRAKDVPDMRRYLQRLGTEGVRQVFGPTAWVDALARRLEQDQPKLVAISDVRFLSEAEWIIKQPGCQLWRVNRLGVGGDDPHPSERDIPSLPASVDITATNLEELEREVVAVLHHPRYFNQTLLQEDRLS